MNAPPSCCLPITFVPLYQTRVWGGQRMGDLLNRSLPPDILPCGESWEICDREEAQSLVAEGHWAGKSLHFLWQCHRRELFGPNYAAHPASRFPLLLKILDACEDLSLQVHPTAEAAPRLEGEPKTEMWYVAHADPEARIYAGLKEGVTRKSFQQALSLGEISGAVHQIRPRQGQSLFLPSGRLHAMGRGLLVYEIQQNSDTTYRVFDWNRPGLDGKPRSLHVEESMQCIDFEDFSPQMKDGGEMTHCEHFQVNKVTLSAHEKRSALQKEQFAIFTVVEGEVDFGAARPYQKGDFLLLPACAFPHVMMQAGDQGAELLEVTLPWQVT